MRFKSLALILLVFCLSATIAQQAMNNDAVIKLTKAGLSDDLVINTINSQPGSYDTTTNGLIALKTAGVSDNVISAMLLKNNAASQPTPAVQSRPDYAAAAPAASAIPPEVDDIGAYYKDQSGHWNEITAEIVNWKTGGVLKSIATDGIVKGDVNGNIKGSKSPLTLPAPVDIIIRAAEGNQIGEYQLLHLHSHSHDREFRSVTGGVFHESGGAQRDNISFESKKIGPHTYEVLLPATVEKGEYGLLPPGEGVASNKNIASSGKIYTFNIQ